MPTESKSRRLIWSLEAGARAAMRIREDALVDEDADAGLAAVDFRTWRTSQGERDDDGRTRRNYGFEFGKTRLLWKDVPRVETLQVAFGHESGQIGPRLLSRRVAAIRRPTLEICFPLSACIRLLAVAKPPPPSSLFRYTFHFNRRYVTVHLVIST